MLPVAADNPPKENYRCFSRVVEVQAHILNLCLAATLRLNTLHMESASGQTPGPADGEAECVSY